MADFITFTTPFVPSRGKVIQHGPDRYRVLAVVEVHNHPRAHVMAGRIAQRVTAKVERV